MTACDPGCRGWAHFNVGEERESIERCDECARYPSDKAAARVHAKHCRCGATEITAIQRCHTCQESSANYVVVDERVYCEECAPTPDKVACPKCGGQDRVTLRETFRGYHPVRGRNEDGGLIIEHALTVISPSERFSDGDEDYVFFCEGCTHEWPVPEEVQAGEWDWE